MTYVLLMVEYDSIHQVKLFVEPWNLQAQLECKKWLLHGLGLA